MHNSKDDRRWEKIEVLYAIFSKNYIDMLEELTIRPDFVHFNVGLWSETYLDKIIGH